MRHSLLPTAAIVWTLAQGAAVAATASQMFADVPAGPVRDGLALLPDRYLGWALRSKAPTLVLAT